MEQSKTRKTRLHLSVENRSRFSRKSFPREKRAEEERKKRKACGERIPRTAVARDERLLAVQDVLVALALGRCPERAGVRAGVGLRQAVAAEGLPDDEDIRQGGKAGAEWKKLELEDDEGRKQRTARTSGRGYTADGKAEAVPEKNGEQQERDIEAK